MDVLGAWDSVFHINEVRIDWLSPDGVQAVLNMHGSPLSDFTSAAPFFFSSDFL